MVEREDRYLVIRRTDLEAAFKVMAPTTIKSFRSVVDMAEKIRIHRGKLPICCVVVEHDWPEYEPTWKAIEMRVDLAEKDRIIAQLRASIEELTGGGE